MALLASLRRAVHVRCARSFRRAHAALLPTLSKNRASRPTLSVLRAALLAAAILLAVLALGSLAGGPLALLSGRAPQLPRLHASKRAPGGLAGVGGADRDPGDEADAEWDGRPDPKFVAASRKRWPSRTVRSDLEDELWNKVKHDVVIGVKTGHEVAAKRLSKLREFGWWSVGRDVPNLLVLSDDDDADLGTVGVKPYGLELLRNETAKQGADKSGGGGDAAGARNNNDDDADDGGEMPSHWFEKSGWRGDKDKNLPALHVLRREFPGKKWYLLLDDDTYIFLENFARYISQGGMDARPVYTGKVFYISRCGGFAHDGTLAANRSAPRGMFAHGGSGIVLNAMAMERVFPTLGACIREFSSCWAGDMQVALCLRRVGVVVRRVGRRRAFEKHFIPFWPSKALADRRYSARWRSAGEPLTFHKLPDAEMRLVSSLDRVSARGGESVVYDELRTHLLRHGVVPAHSKRDRANKYYSTEFAAAGAGR